MSELKLILKKLDQISNRLDLLEKKIEKPDRKKSTPETPPNKVEEWKISQELMNREKNDSDLKNIDWSLLNIKKEYIDELLNYKFNPLYTNEFDYSTAKDKYLSIYFLLNNLYLEDNDILLLSLTDRQEIILICFFSILTNSLIIFNC